MGSNWVANALSPKCPWSLCNSWIKLSFVHNDFVKTILDLCVCAFYFNTSMKLSLNVIIRLLFVVRHRFVLLLISLSFWISTISKGFCEWTKYNISMKNVYYWSHTQLFVNTVSHEKRISFLQQLNCESIEFGRSSTLN